MTINTRIKEKGEEYPNGISVVICCYNSALRLSETLKHLALQQVPNTLSWEIIVVDNCSQDNTLDLALQTWNEWQVKNVDLVAERELTPGLSYARNTGIQKAKYPYVVFCDDDNWLNKDYLHTAYKILSDNPKIGATGGKSVAVANRELPEWFEKNSNAYATGEQAPTSCYLTKKGYLWGSGLALKKQIYLDAYKNVKSFLTDRKGEEITSGGDTEICLRIILLGYELWYDERLQFRHFIENYRLNESYLNSLYQSFSSASNINSKYYYLIEVRSYKFINRMKMFILSCIRSLLFFINAKSKRNNQCFYYLSCLIGLNLVVRDKIFGKILKEWN